MIQTQRRLSILIAGTCLAALLVQPVAAAQDQVPPASPESRTLSAPQAQQSPSEWVRQALQSNKEEIAISQEAAKRSSNAEVRQYAQMLVQDHGKTVERLGELGTRHGIAALPTDSEAVEEQARTRLSLADDVSFDRAYLDLMVQSHESAIANYTGASQLSDEEVAAYARETLPTLRKHHEQARLLRQSLRATNDVAGTQDGDEGDHPMDRDYE